MTIEQKTQGPGLFTRVVSRLDTLEPWKKDLLSVLVLAVVPLLFLSNVLFTDQVLVGENLARYYPWRADASEEMLQRPSNQRIDPLYQYYPQRIIAADTVRTGGLPLWNPYYLAGVPFLATEILAGFFYPPNVIYYLIDPLEAFGLSAYWHLLLAGVSMYLYLGSIRLDKISALVGATSFQLSGYLLVNLMWLSRVSTAAWAPFLFFCFEKYWRERQWRYAMLLSLAVGMCILAGTPMVFVFVMLALAIYVTSKLVYSLSERGLTEAAKTSAVAFCVVGLGVLLAAVQLIPTYEASAFFERARGGYEDALDKGRSPSSLATALVPDIYGNPVDPTWLSWGADRFGNGVPENYARPNIYAGILPLFMASWAVAFRRNAYVVFFAALAVLSLSLFLNIPSVVFRALYLIPVFRVGRLMEVKVAYAFSVCVLAGWGSNSLRDLIKKESTAGMRRAGHIVLAIAATTLVGAVMAGLAYGTNGSSSFPVGWVAYNIPNVVRFGLPLLACALLVLLGVRVRLGVYLYAAFAIGLVIVDMFCFGWKFNTPQRRQDLFFETDGIRFLEQDTDLFRIIRGPQSRRVLPSNTPAVYGIGDAQGYTSLMLDYYGDFMDLVEPDVARIRGIRPLKTVKSLSSKLLDLLNVKYIVAAPEASQELLEFDEAHEDIDLVHDGDMRIYQNRDVLPRAFVVYDFIVAPEKEHALGWLASDEFDPAGCVILDREPSLVSTAAPGFTVQSSVSTVEYAPNRVTIEAKTSRDGLLVLSDLYYNGWKAFVDGEEQAVYRADYVFRAVELPAGRHIVEFRFDPASFRIGLSLSILTFIIVSSGLLCSSLNKI